MTGDPSNVTGAELIDAFMHPPRLVSIAQRVESADGGVRVFSHSELWPWRTVIRGAYAHRVPYSHSSPDDPGIGDWVAGWQLDDDLGTEYDCRSGGVGGSGGDLWATFDVEFEPNVPSQATRLTVVSPEGDRIELAI